jgi:hypothetical protein
MHLMYLERGRPAAPGQMATAAVEGSTGRRHADEQRAVFAGFRQSDVRPEWGEMLVGVALPVPAAVPADAARSGRRDRRPRSRRTGRRRIATRPRSWTRSTRTGSSRPRRRPTRTRRRRRCSCGHASPRVHGRRRDGRAVTAKLPQAGRERRRPVPKVLATWKHEREIVRQRLTATQVKKAYTKAVRNPATGAAWTRDDALAELLSRGWSAQDANTFLDE